MNRDQLTRSVCHLPAYYCPFRWEIQVETKHSTNGQGQPHLGIGIGIGGAQATYKIPLSHSSKRIQEPLVCQASLNHCQRICPIV